MNASRFTLEIAANSLESALAAQAGGADRIELCENLGEGGTTPSFGMLSLAREQLRIPLHVLIRPRGGDFVYSPVEWEIMLRDIELCARIGVDGVVIGALDAEGSIDMAGCRALAAAAGGLHLTFHRAFDCVADRAVALEQAVELGCTRILTSGAADSALEGAGVIAADITRAQGRLALMAGAGINAGNVEQVAKASGAHQFHASCKAFVAGTGREGPAGLERGYWRSSEAGVRALRVALDGIPG